MQIETKYFNPGLNISKFNKTDFFFVFLLMFFSGNPVLELINIDLAFVSCAFFLFFVALFSGKLNIFNSSLFIKTILFLILLFIIQTIKLDYNQTYTYCGFICKLFITYVVIKLVKDFLIVFINVMYIISIVSLFFFSLYYIYPSILDYTLNIIGEHEFYYYHKSLIFYTFQIINGSEMRNSGLFKEPGLFAGYINLAIIFLYARKKQFTQKKFKQILLILIITLLSTFSTQGYLVLGLIILYVFFSDLKTNSSFLKFVKLIFIPVLISLLVFLFIQLSFLNNKINNEQEMAFKRENNYEITRIGGFLSSMKYIIAEPITGWGIDVINSINTISKARIITTGTGMTDFILKLGLPVFMFFCSRVYLLLNLFFNKLLAFYFLGLILILIQGEPFFNYPIIYFLYFLRPVKNIVQ